MRQTTARERDDLGACRATALPARIGVTSRILTLQRLAGNDAVAALLAAGPRPVQRVPLTGNTVSDVVVGTGLSAATNLAWLAGAAGARRHFLPVSGGGFGTGMYSILVGHPPLPGGVDSTSAPAHPGWNALTRKRPASGGAVYYVRAHLLAEQFGGPATWNNLVPLTNLGNNPSPLSHLKTVEDAINAQLNRGRTIGYRVVPIYSQLPFGLPRLVVDTLVGVLPGGWLAELRDLLYWETQIPTALWTSWWDQRSWNPLPNTRLIRNWANPDDTFSMRLYVPLVGRRDLTREQMGLLAAAEVAKLAVSAGLPAGPLWPMVTRLAGWAGVAGLVPSGAGADALHGFLERTGALLPWWASAMESAGLGGMLHRPRHAAGGRYGGWIPSVPTLVAGVAGVAAVAGRAFGN
jgi:hypothetical protein